MLDSYYTPRDAAEKLVAQLGIEPRLVGDFCAGGGELLRACESKFPWVKCVAVDKSRRAIRHIHTAHEKWQVFLANFLSVKDMARTGLQSNTFDLVVLNPPFTCRGKKYKINLDGRIFSGSKALMFLVRALSYVRRGGALRAILPSGTICAERDEELVWYLKRRYQFRVYWRASQISFCGKTPNVIFVDMRKPLDMVIDKVTYMTMARKKFKPPTYLSRGCLNVVDANKLREKVHKDGLLRYVHTTDMRQGEIIEPDFWVDSVGRRIVSGSSVLLPRVGMPSKDKVCLIADSKRYILSDCVLAICCKNAVESKRLRQLIFEQWDKYQKIYVGTGAQYTTLRRLDSFLSQVGWDGYKE